VSVCVGSVINRPRCCPVTVCRVTSCRRVWSWHAVMSTEAARATVTDTAAVCRPGHQHNTQTSVRLVTNTHAAAVETCISPLFCLYWKVQQQQQPFCSHYVGQHVSACTPVKNRTICGSRVLLPTWPCLTATNAFELGRRCLEYSWVMLPQHVSLTDTLMQNHCVFRCRTWHTPGELSLDIFH